MECQGTRGGRMRRKGESKCISTNTQKDISFWSHISFDGTLLNVLIAGGKSWTRRLGNLLWTRPTVWGTSTNKSTLTTSNIIQPLILKDRKHIFTSKMLLIGWSKLCNYHHHCGFGLSPGTGLERSWRLADQATVLLLRDPPVLNSNQRLQANCFLWTSQKLKHCPSF